MDLTPNFSLTLTLWDELVRTDSRNAAAGFIHDVFEQYVRNETSTDEVRSRLLEDLLHILEDNDGSRVREWLRLIKVNPAEFKVKATQWADLCCEMAE